MPIHVVNMVPQSMSAETNQDSEPNLAVDPTNINHVVATAFTPAPAGGSNAPVYVSSNGGTSWTLNMIVPGNGQFGTGDITTAFAGSGGTLYAGILNGATFALQILRTSNPFSSTVMTVLEQRANEDQPWTVAATTTVGGSGQDRVYVGNNDFSQSGGETATVDLSTNAATAAPPAGFAPHKVEWSAPSLQDGPPTRIAVHSDGTVYAAFTHWTTTSSFPDFNFDVRLTRDDSWGSGPSPFTALQTSVATGLFAVWNSVMGQERLGADLAIAVDPATSNNVYLAYCDRVGGASGTDWTLHVVRSTNKGQTWSGDVRTITNAKNPALAVSSASLVGLLYQQFVNNNWTTILELTSNAWATAATSVTLHSAPATTPTATFQPYIGDYVRLLAVGTNFYGVFSGNNTADAANFPQGVVYQRNANWTTHTLLSIDNVTPVAASIDPFFFHWSPLVFPITPRGVIQREPILRQPVTTTPVTRTPITTTPITRTPTPVARQPVTPIDPGPIRAQDEEGGSTVDL
jgi:hypothetical protein